MKILKYIGYSLLAIILLFVILAFVLPTKQHIEVEKEISVPKNMVFNAINDLRAHEIWSPFKADDETMVFIPSDKLVGKDASYTWTSEKQGNGSYLILESDPEKGTKSKIMFDERNGGIEQITLTEEDGKTKMNWVMDFEAGRFMNVMAPIFKIFLKATFKKGIENIESLVLKRLNTSEYYGYKVREEVTPLRFFATKRFESAYDNVQQVYTSNLSALFSDIHAAQVEIKGKECTLIYNFKPQESKVDMAAAIALEQEINIPGAILQTIPSGKSAIVDYYGDVKDIRKAHLAIQTYLNDKGLFFNYPVLEEKMTDPTLETDNSKWLTEIIYPIAN